MRRYKSPVSGLKSGVASGLGRLRNSSQIITADTAPVLAALDDADTPAAGFTSGVYSSTAGTISSETAVYLVDDVEQLGTYDLTAGEVVQVREDVVDSAANERSFYTGSQIVQPSVALSNSAVPTIDQAIVGEVSTATTGTWAGSASRTYSYQWKVDGSNVGTDTNTYTPQVADDGLDLTVTVTADDGFTQVPATSAATTVAVAVPVLTTPTASADGQNGVKTLSVITDTGDGTLVASTYPAADTPTAAAVELGTGAAITDSKTVVATGLQTFPAGTGLDPITPYKVWYVHRSAGGQLSAAVASATFYTDPGVYAAAGVADIEVNDGLDNPTVVVTVGGVEVFNGSVTLLNLQADAYALVDPAIGVVGGGDPATDSTLEDLDEDVWTFDPAINPSPAPTRQWDSDGAPVSGATASTYAITASEVDTDMTLDKTLLGITTPSNAIVIPPVPAGMTATRLSITGDGLYAIAPNIAIPSFTLTEPTLVVFVMGGQIDDNAKNLTTDININGQSLSWTLYDPSSGSWSRTIVASATLPAGTYDHLYFVGDGSTFLRFMVSIATYKVEGGAINSVTQSTSSWATNDAKTVSPTVAVDDFIIVAGASSRSSGDGVQQWTAANNCTEVYDSGTPGEAAGSGAGGLFLGEHTSVSAGALAVGAQWTGGGTNINLNAIVLRAV